MEARHGLTQGKHVGIGRGERERERESNQGKHSRSLSVSNPPPYSAYVVLGEEVAWVIQARDIWQPHSAVVVASVLDALVHKHALAQLAKHLGCAQQALLLPRMHLLPLELERHAAVHKRLWVNNACSHALESKLSRRGLDEVARVPLLLPRACDC